MLFNDVEPVLFEDANISVFGVYAVDAYLGWKYVKLTDVYSMRITQVGHCLINPIAFMPDTKVRVLSEKATRINVPIHPTKMASLTDEEIDIDDLASVASALSRLSIPTKFVTGSNDMFSTPDIRKGDMRLRPYRVLELTAGGNRVRNARSRSSTPLGSQFYRDTLGAMPDPTGEERWIAMSNADTADTTHHYERSANMYLVDQDGMAMMRLLDPKAIFYEWWD